MKILLVRKLGRNSMTLKLNISLRPFDLPCMSAQKLGFSSFDCFFLFFSLNCFNLYSSEKFTNGPGAQRLCKMKGLHRFCPSGPELSKVKLCIKCDYPILDMWFSRILFWHPCIKGQDTVKQTGNNIAKQGWRRRFKGCWLKKCLSRDSCWLLPPGRDSHGDAQLWSATAEGTLRPWSGVLLACLWSSKRSPWPDLLEGRIFTFSLLLQGKAKQFSKPLSSRWPEIAWNAFISCLFAAASASICWKPRLMCTKELFRNHERMNHHVTEIDPPDKFRWWLFRSFHSPGDVRCLK